MGIEGKSFLDQTSLVVNSTPKTAQFVFASATFSKEDLFKVIKLGCIKPSTLFLDLLPPPPYCASAFDSLACRRAVHAGVTRRDDLE